MGHFLILDGNRVLPSVSDPHGLGGPLRAVAGSQTRLQPESSVTRPVRCRFLGELLPGRRPCPEEAAPAPTAVSRSRGAVAQSACRRHPRGKHTVPCVCSHTHAHTCAHMPAVTCSGSCYHGEEDHFACGTRNRQDLSCAFAQQTNSLSHCPFCEALLLDENSAGIHARF